VRLGKP